MPYYDSETIERARQVDLLTYLQTCEPQELVHVSGNVYCTKTHDSLRISNGKWCWFSRGIGGYSALDYLIKERLLNDAQSTGQKHLKNGPILVADYPIFYRKRGSKHPVILFLPRKNWVRTVQILPEPDKLQQKI